jgi:hypothetical protein
VCATTGIARPWPCQGSLSRAISADRRRASALEQLRETSFVAGAGKLVRRALLLASSRRRAMLARSVQGSAPGVTTATTRLSRGLSLVSSPRFATARGNGAVRSSYILCVEVILFRVSCV